MPYPKFTIISWVFIGLSAYAAIPTNEDFVVLENFPQAADGAFGVVGTAMPDGRFLLWNGDEVFLQSVSGENGFEVIASGYAGDPGFVAMSPDGVTVLLGAGFSPMLYLLNLSSPMNFVPGSEIAVPTHFWGVYLTDSLVALDRSKDDSSGSEIIIVDLTSVKGISDYRAVLSHPVVGAEKQDLVLDKPPSSFSSTLAIDPSSEVLYVLDANTRALKTFAVSALISAFQDGTTLDWEADGTMIGDTGQFFSGGVSGFTPEGYLVIGGSEGFLQPGGIQFVDPTPPATVLSTLDPAGTSTFYSAIYSPTTDELIVIEAFQSPIVAHGVFASAGEGEGEGESGGEGQGGNEGEGEGNLGLNCSPKGPNSASGKAELLVLSLLVVLARTRPSRRLGR